MTEIEYNKCVNDYADNVYRFVLKNLRHEADAQDVVQTAFETLWEQRAKVVTDNVKSLLFTIAYRKMIDFIRSRKRTVYHEEMSAFDKADIPKGNHLRSVLTTALNTLDDTKRSLVLLKDYEGYSYEEISEITGLNASQVKVYLHRARLQLRAYIVKMENVIT
ncbi:MAG: RNA polymerase sigma factor [Niabella sp.]